MNNEIVLTVPSGATNDWIADYVQSGAGIDLESILDLDVSHIDDRAIVDLWEVTEVEVTDDLVTIKFRLEYSIFYGCKDIDIYEDEEREVEGVRHGTEIIFAPYIPPEPRSTFEEY